MPLKCSRTALQYVPNWVHSQTLVQTWAVGQEGGQCGLKEEAKCHVVVAETVIKCIAITQGCQLHWTGAFCSQNANHTVSMSQPVDAPNFKKY